MGNMTMPDPVTVEIELGVLEGLLMRAEKAQSPMVRYSKVENIMRDERDKAREKELIGIIATLKLLLNQ